MATINYKTTIGSTNTEAIINVQFSSIGYGYPRIFIRTPVDGDTNMDVTLGACFRMKAGDFESWIDEDLITDKSFEDICKNTGLDAASLNRFVDEFVGGIASTTEDEFFARCTAHGGNWTAMLLSGIKSCWPTVYESIPDDLTLAFDDVVFLVKACCVDTSATFYGQRVYTHLNEMTGLVIQWNGTNFVFDTINIDSMTQRDVINFMVKANKLDPEKVNTWLEENR